MDKQKVTGIILAGGQSRRMGTEKGLVEFRGRRMIDYALEALKPVCSQILISANSDAYDSFGIPVIHDEIPGSGPMGGILSCLQKSENELNFVLSCDMPLVTAKVVTTILDKTGDNFATVPCHGNGYLEPLCAVYHKSLIPEFEIAIQNKNLKIFDLLNRVNTKKINITPGSGMNPSTFFNVNSRIDLEALSGKTAAEASNNSTDLLKLRNLLMIAGTGRKVGKTTFACRTIRYFSASQKITAIKVSPHLHHQSHGQKVIVDHDHYQIIEETNTGNTKDSSRMLAAGASRVFYLQTIDRNIREPFEKLLSLIPREDPVICESGALLDYARPGLFILIKRKGQTAFKKGLDKLSYQPDVWVAFDGEDFSIAPEAILWDNNSWKLTGD